MVAYLFKKHDKDLKTMKDEELLSGIKSRRNGMKVVRWAPTVGTLALTLGVFAMMPMGIFLGLAVSVGISIAVGKLSAPWTNKVSSRLSTEYTTMEREMLDRMDKREKAEKAAAKQADLDAKATAAAHAAAGTKPLTGQIAEEFKQAKAAGMPTTEDITVRKISLKFKKPGDSAQP
ncbi:MAG: hypothetical protein ACAH80_00115 [Alphaproteobacteria bacterium]